MRYSFTIPGKPFGKQSRAVSREGRSYVPEKTKNYMNEVKWLFRSSIKGHKLIKGAVSVTLTAYYKIPKVSKKLHEEMLLGEVRPIIKPDCDNISKVICDALTDECWVDDNQVTDLVVRKWYSDDPRVDVEITY